MAKRHFHSNPSFKLNCNEKSAVAAGTRDTDCVQEQKGGKGRETAREAQSGNKAAGKPSSKKKLQKQIQQRDKQRCLLFLTITERPQISFYFTNGCWGEGKILYSPVLTSGGERWDYGAKSISDVTPLTSAELFLIYTVGCVKRIMPIKLSGQLVSNEYVSLCDPNTYEENDWLIHSNSLLLNY